MPGFFDPYNVHEKIFEKVNIVAKEDFQKVRTVWFVYNDNKSHKGCLIICEKEGKEGYIEIIDSSKSEPIIINHLNYPAIVVNTNQTIEGMIYVVLHEIGHLLGHKKEEDADNYAIEKMKMLGYECKVEKMEE